MLIIDPSRFTQSLGRHVVVCIVQVDRVTARRDDAPPEPGQHANDVRVSDWQVNRVYRPVLRCRRHRAGLDRLDPHCPALGRRRTWAAVPRASACIPIVASMGPSLVGRLGRALRPFTTVSTVMSFPNVPALPKPAALLPSTSRRSWRQTRRQERSPRR